MLDNILQVILTKLNRALIKHFSLRLMVNVSDMVQEYIDAKNFNQYVECCKKNIPWTL